MRWPAEKRQASALPGESPVRFHRLASAAVLLGSVLGLPATAQTTGKTYLAFGDSITAGVGDDLTRAAPGYPPRLQSLLHGGRRERHGQELRRPRREDPDGARRASTASSPPGKLGDVLILMEGTNDINRADLARDHDLRSRHDGAARPRRSASA